jgi:hypothetical protein
MRFDEAAFRAIQIADQWAVAHDEDVVVVRDLLGRNALAIEGSRADVDVAGLEKRLRDECRPFVGGEAVLVLSEMFAPELILKSPDLKPAPFTISTSGRVSVIERGTVGAEWLSPIDAPAGCRVALYGFKGGVGRSTATFALAQHIAQTGRIVLVIDLDLESPGVSTMLAPNLDDLPEHGILDHLIEHGVGNESGLDLVVRSEAVGPIDGNGEVWLAAANGRPGARPSYLDKLSRAYLALPANPAIGREPLSFGARIEAAVAACEAQVEQRSRRPDVVLLDSRSGIHDVAAVAITQLSSLSLLFATDDQQTWQGYGELFARWQTRLDPAERSALRNRVQMVAALVPQADRESYLRRFADRAQACFATTLYDDEQGEDSDAFNFAPQDESAPHFPIPIHHSVDLIGVVPGVDPRWRSGGSVTFAYADFLARATELILEAHRVEL